MLNILSNIELDRIFSYTRHSIFLHQPTFGDSIWGYVKMLESTAYLRLSREQLFASKSFLAMLLLIR